MRYHALFSSPPFIEVNSRKDWKQRWAEICVQRDPLKRFQLRLTSI